MVGVAGAWDPADLAAFSRRFNVRVDAHVVASDQQLLQQLSGAGHRYDVVLTNAEHALVESNLGLLRVLDHDLLPNLSKVDSRWSGLLSDPHNRFTVAKDAGVTGIVRRKDRLAHAPHTWAEFFAAAKRPSVRVSVSNDAVLVVGLALAALGHSVNSDNSDDLDAAGDLLQQVRPYVSSIGASPVAAFSAGRVDLAMADTDQAREIQTSRAAYLDTATTLPRRGRMWIRALAIAAAAPHPVAAHALINYFLDPRVGARETAYGGGDPGTPASLDVIRPREFADDPLVAVPDDVLKGSDVLKPTPLGLQHRFDIWSQFTGF